MRADGYAGAHWTSRLGTGLFCIVLGAAGSGVLVQASNVADWRLLLGVTLAIPLAVLAVLRPRIGMLLFIFAIGFVEEFRGGIGDQGAGGDEYLRSERTPFYGATVGVPGIYLPDVLVGGLLLLFLVRAFVWRTRIGLKGDKIGLALALLLGAVVISIVLGLAGQEPFGPPVLDLSSLGSIKLPEKNVTDVARYFPVLQYKLFLILFPSYILGLLFFREERDVRQMLAVLMLAMIATVVLGTYRFATNTAVLKALVPVIFDTGSVELMAMTVFYIVGMWACGRYRPGEVLPRIVLCAALLLFIVLSFRRTMWGAIALAALFFPFILPPRARGRLMLLTVFGIVAVLIVAGTTPAGQALLQSVLSRAQETNLSQSSTLYRFAIVTWMVDHVADIPWFGYGLMPLWNEIVRIRFFVTSMENVHSLYMWILLRMGFFGLFVSGVTLSLILLRLREVYADLDDHRDRVLVGVVFLAIVMYLFNGIFNPVYANVRHLVPLGLSLALMTNLPSIAAKRRALRSSPRVSDEAPRPA